jgi:regulator of nucleoside diphosphate kinase
MARRPPIILTTADRERLHALIDAAPALADPDTAEFLREEIERADIVTREIAPTSVVRMGSMVQFIDQDDRWIRRARLVFPEEVRDASCISVLSPIGTALIGLGPGQSILWSEHGRDRRLSVLAVQAAEGRVPKLAKETKK